MAFKLMWAGQDVSAYVDEATIDIKDTLGQGAGTGTVVSGRSAQFEFYTTLGPVYTAVGAGTVVSTPQLVRMGEVKLYDLSLSATVPIFGGYAVQFEDVSGKTVQMRRTKVDCYDYWQHLDRIMVDEVYDGLWDSQTIVKLCSKYAPWINLSQILNTFVYQFGPVYYRNMSLQKAIQSVADVVGYQVWITTDKVLHYLAPTSAQTAIYSISDSPNYTTTFPGLFTDETFDDTSAINRVYFYGGKVPSNDFTQDLSMFANSSNTTFPLAYYPRSASDGKVHVNINGGADLVLGSATGVTTGPVTKTTNPAKNILKPAGLADVLINYDAHTLVFAYAPTTGSTVTCRYRYEYPLVVVVPDPNGGNAFWGMWLDGNISDNTVFSRSQAIQRAKVLLLEQSRGLRTLMITTFKGGLQAGQIIHVDNTVRGIHDNFIIQEVETVVLGGAGAPANEWQYELTLGAWSWNLIDVMRSAMYLATPADTSTDASSTELDALETYDNLKATVTQTIAYYNSTVYYARLTAVGDGNDAYCGLCSITS